ncbi:FAD-binding oxidoreductase [Antarcticibacterium arcticum]|uniref:FAD-binding oxidoreductase n=1 Tax=Antarcticibacterium arcticum TaxID=2585771 RepID=A0A5B8YK60_9FLAO|nr:FAD-dependent oxidoreductase [Antarcticibacterium arcticum]QED38410.1 FAD-binding oxidoreductase [Antarcticibacterium arcticum]
MNLSYWEYQSWLSNIDYTIVGSGIVGLNAALQLKEKYPAARILILERGFLPNGASTKNAGFACFGSLSEILDDLESHSEEMVVNLVRKRIKGLELLRKTIGDKTMDYHIWGGYEFFPESDEKTQAHCISRMHIVNKLLHRVFNEKVFIPCGNRFNFKNIREPLIFNKFEGQINTGKMMEALLHKVQKAGIKILNNIMVEEITDGGNSVEVKTNQFEFNTKKLLIASNGFASKFGIPNVKPARAQVLVTKPIKNLQIKGTFHLDKGYYYFRNIDGRILFGGGRNLDLKGEETTEMTQTALIQDKLEELLKTTILPDTLFEIDQRWSGIMGVGETKEPIIKHLSPNVVCGVRLGGMGVAIGSLTGREMADLATN